MGQHGPPGDPGGPAGVRQQSQVVARLDRCLPAGCAGGLEQRQEVLDRGALRQGGDQVGPGPPGRGQWQPQLQPGRAREVVGYGRDHDMLERGVTADSCQRVVHPVQAHDDLRAAVDELVPQLGLGVERVVLDDNGAQAQGREEGDDVLRAVGQHDRHPVTLGDAESGQRSREGVHRCLELPVGEACAEEGERDPVRERCGRVIQQARQRHLREVVVGGHAHRVAGEPRPVGVRRGGGRRGGGRRWRNSPTKRRGGRGWPGRAGSAAGAGAGARHSYASTWCEPGRSVARGRPDRVAVLPGGANSSGTR